MRIYVKKSVLYVFCIFTIHLYNCNNIGYEYKDTNGGISFSIKVPTKKEKSIFEFGVTTNNSLPFIEKDYPSILANYSTNSQEIENLRKLEVKLFVKGKEIPSDENEYYIFHGTNAIPITEDKCCSGLSEVLGIDSQRKKFPIDLTIHIYKKYKSLKGLPPNLIVYAKTTTVQGVYDIKKELTLSTYKTSNFIRIH